MFNYKTPDMEKLTQKKILIVGATGGIGSQTAKLLAGSGAELYLSGRKADQLAALADSLKIPQERLFITIQQTSRQSMPWQTKSASKQVQLIF